MARYELLNNVAHKDLKVNTEKSAALGNNQTYTYVYPFEFKHAQADYPIFFIKDKKTGKYQAIALFGFEDNENLYLTEQGWNASYIPLMVEREPFLIGFQNQPGQEQQAVIHIDMDSPRLNKDTGMDIFLEHGGNSDYINHISTILKTIHDGQTSTDQFMDKVQSLDLLEPINLDIQLNDGSNHRLAGFFTLNEDKLRQLSGDQLVELNQSGMLNVLYMVIASHANLTSLIQKKEQQRQANT